MKQDECEKCHNRVRELIFLPELSKLVCMDCYVKHKLWGIK